MVKNIYSCTSDTNFDSCFSQYLLYQIKKKKKVWLGKWAIYWGKRKIGGPYFGLRLGPYESGQGWLIIRSAAQSSLFFSRSLCGSQLEEIVMATSEEKAKEKEGSNLLGSPTFKELENGRFQCVETGHEVVAKDKEIYSQSKRCRLGLVDFALSHKKPPLNMFKQDPLSRYFNLFLFHHPHS